MPDPTPNHPAVEATEGQRAGRGRTWFAGERVFASVRPGFMEDDKIELSVYEGVACIACLTPSQAREVAAHLIACADLAEGEPND